MKFACLQGNHSWAPTAALWQKKQRRSRFSLLKWKSSAATCIQNSSRCRYFSKISSKKNDGIQIRYPMVKFQLYLRKLQFKLLKYWYRLQLALAGFNGKQLSKSLFNWLLACSFQKNKHFKTLVGNNQRFRNYFKKLPIEVTLGR